MSTFIICNNVTFHGSDEAIKEVKKLVNSYKEEQKRIASNKEWIKMMIWSGNYKTSEIFSDVYKDTYGIRPHWLYQ